MSHQHEFAQTYASLTKHPEGSLKEIFTISFPIMLTVASGLLMLFVDRLILAQHSTEAMNASVATGLAGFVFISFTIGIALIAEVFVGKANGAQKYSKVAVPVWQMIWFSLLSSVGFWLVAYFGTPFIAPINQFNGHGYSYFQWLMLVGPMFPLTSAVTSFFIGIGRVKIVTAVAIIANLCNAALSWMLIFGLGTIPALGPKGAAIATGISHGIQFAILFSIFLSKNNRKKYGTTNWAFDKETFLKCLRIGGPNALGHMIEISAWALLARLMANAGDLYVTVLSIGQSCSLLFMFCTEGLQKGVTAIASNFIGAKKFDKIIPLLKSAFVLLVIIVAIIGIVLLLFQDSIIKLLLDNAHESNAELFALAKQAIFWIWLYLLLDGLVWIFAGVLTASEDTKFVMITNALTAWFCALLPTYLFITVWQGAPGLNWVIVNVYAAVNVFLFFLRVKIKQNPVKLYG